MTWLAGSGRVGRMVGFGVALLVAACGTAVEDGTDVGGTPTGAGGAGGSIDPDGTSGLAASGGVPGSASGGGPGAPADWDAGVGGAGAHASAGPDAAASGTGGSAEPDAQASRPDAAAVPEPDAAPPDPDAEMMPEPDAAKPEPDVAAMPEPDAATMPQPDAAKPAPDAAKPAPDAAAPPPDAQTPKPDAQTPRPDAAGTGVCNSRIQKQANEGSTHVMLCSDITYGTNPPSSGDHYPAWAAYRTYSRPIPWGFLVHSLEHGGIVIAYNCPDGCANEVAQAQAFIDSLPVTCPGGVKRKLILMPDPKLDVRFAASAWDWTLKADCFDAQAFQRFYNLRYNHGREDSCNQGTDPTGESTGRRPMCGL